MGGNDRPHFRRGIGDGKEFDRLGILGTEGGIFGGMVTAERARSDDGSFQRTRFRHTATEKQTGSPRSMDNVWGE